MSAPNYWTRLRHQKISRRTMLGASAKAGVGAAGLALVGCGGDDDDDGGAGDAAAAEAAAAAGDSSAAAAAAERAAAAAEEAAAAAAAAGDAGAAAVAEAAAAAAAAAAEAAREAGADQAQAAAEAAAAAAAAAEDAAAAAREAAAAATAGDEEMAPAGDYNLDASLVLGYDVFSSTLDPQAQAGFGGHSAFNIHCHFDNPVARTADGSAGQGGASDWEFVDANANILFTFRQGVMYHNGDPVTAEEFKFNLERTGGRWAGDPNFVGRAADFATFGEPRIEDEFTARVAMDPPSSGAPSILTRLPMMSRRHAEEQGPDGVAQHPVGFGAFKFLSWEADQEIRSTRNDDFLNSRDFAHEKRLPYIKNATATNIPEAQARLFALEAGEIDVALRIAPDLAEPFEADDDFVVWFHRAQRGLHLQLPQHLLENAVGGGPNPWRDRRVRIAANLAVDVDLIINEIMTGQEFHTYTLAVDQGGNDGPQGPLADKDWGYDPDRARALLEEAGWGDGFDTEIRYPAGLYTNSDTFFQAVGGMLREVGIRAEIRTQEISQYFSDLREKKTDVPFLMPQSAGNHPLIAVLESSRTPAVFSHRIEELSDPIFEEIEALYDEAEAEFDQDKQNALLNEGAHLHYDQASWIYLFELVQPTVAAGNLEWPQFANLPSTVEVWNLRQRNV